MLLEAVTATLLLLCHASANEVSSVGGVVVEPTTTIGGNEQQLKQISASFDNADIEYAHCTDADDTKTVTTTTVSSLHRARQLQVPNVESRLGGELENIDFWKQHEVVLRQAWQEWDAWNNTKKNLILQLHENPVSLLNSTLAERIQAAWDHPTVETEQNVKDLWQEVPTCNGDGSGVFIMEDFFSPTGILALREGHLDAAAATNAGIPTRRPNGMNRFGLVLDEHVEGGVSYPTLDTLRRWLISTCIRPVARAMFPEYTHQPFSSSPFKDEDEHQEYSYNDDVSYAFTVHYNSSHCAERTQRVGIEVHGDVDDGIPNWGDRDLPVHSDASLYTLNINLNVNEEDDQDNPAQLVFFGDDDDHNNGTDTTINTTVVITMKPGMAILHRGMHRHQALPLKPPPRDGSIIGQERRRDQLIVWLFGRRHGDYYVQAMPYQQHEQMTVQQRWSMIGDTDHTVGA
jgi:hypothetical protein